MRISVACCLMLVPLLGSGASQTAYAQGNRQSDRRDLVDGILRTLIDSQLNRQPPQQPATDPNRPSVSSARLQDARRTLQSFSQESSNLITALRKEERYSPGIRPLLSDAIRVKAAADVLLQKSQTAYDERLLMADVQALDQQWRLLAHRLSQTPNLGAASLAQVKRLDGYDQQIGRLLQIAPQLDLGELLGLTMSLTTNLANLHEDIGIDLQDRPDRDQLLTEGRRLHVLMGQVTEAVGRNAPRDEIVSRYKQGYQAWQNFGAKIRSAQSRNIIRDIGRIDRTNRRIHELLWIPEQLDRGAIVQLANLVDQGVNELYGDVSLAAYLALPRPDQGITAAKEFRGLCRKFGQSAGTNATREDLMWDFRLLEVEWQQLRDRFQPIEGEGVDQRLARIDWAVGAMRERLQGEAVVDQDAALALAASVDELAVLLDRDLQRRVGQSRQYSAAMRTQLLARSNAFHTSAHRLHEGVVRRDREDQLRSSCNQVADGWRQLAPYLAQLDQNDRVVLGRTYQDIVPQLAKLQILLAY